MICTPYIHLHVYTCTCTWTPHIYRDDMQLTLMSCKLNPFISLLVELKSEGRESLDKLPHSLPRLKGKGNQSYESSRNDYTREYQTCHYVLSLPISPQWIQERMCISPIQTHASHAPFRVGKRWMALGTVSMPTGHFVEWAEGKWQEEE